MIKVYANHGMQILLLEIDLNTGKVLITVVCDCHHGIDPKTVARLLNEGTEAIL